MINLKEGGLTSITIKGHDKSDKCLIKSGLVSFTIHLQPFSRT